MKGTKLICMGDTFAVFRVLIFVVRALILGLRILNSAGLGTVDSMQKVGPRDVNKRRLEIYRLQTPFVV